MFPAYLSVLQGSWGGRIQWGCCWRRGQLGPAPLTPTPSPTREPPLLSHTHLLALNRRPAHPHRTSRSAHHQLEERENVTPRFTSTATDVLIVSFHIEKWRTKSLDTHQQLTFGTSQRFDSSHCFSDMCWYSTKSSYSLTYIYQHSGCVCLIWFITLLLLDNFTHSCTHASTGRQSGQTQSHTSTNTNTHVHAQI